MLQIDAGVDIGMDNPVDKGTYSSLNKVEELNTKEITYEPLSTPMSTPLSTGRFRFAKGADDRSRSEVTKEGMLVVSPIIYGAALRKVMEELRLADPPSVATYTTFRPRLMRKFAEKHGGEMAKLYFPSARTIRRHVTWTEAQQLAADYNPTLMSSFMASQEIVEHLARRKELAAEREREKLRVRQERYKPAEPPVNLKKLNTLTPNQQLIVDAQSELMKRYSKEELRAMPAEQWREILGQIQKELSGDTSD